jgi:hypothetical protein
VTDARTCIDAELPVRRIELMYVPACPRVDHVRAMVRQCLADAGISEIVREREGPYPSPTLLIDGADVVTGEPITGTACCRLDLPTLEQIRSALNGTPA